MATFDLFSTLPEEIKVQITRYAIKPVASRHRISLGYPNTPNLCGSLGAVSKDARKVFCDVVSKDYLYIQISPCKCATRRSHPEMHSEVAKLSEYDRPAPVTEVLKNELKLNLSVLELKIVCRYCCASDQTQIRRFLVTQDTMINVYGLLQGLRSSHSFLDPLSTHIQIKTRCNSTRVTGQATKVLDEMRKIMYEIAIETDSKLPDGYDLAGLSADLARELKTPKDMVRLQESHLCAVQDAMDNGSPLEQFVFSLIHYEKDTIRLDVMEPIALWDIRNWKKTRKHLFGFEMTYDCAVLQGIASYLLSRRLTYEEQSHFFVPKPTCGRSDLESVLSEVDRSIRYYWEFEVDTPGNIPVTMGWMAPIYKARVEFLLAWARLTTLSKFSTMNYLYIRPDEPLVGDLELIDGNEDEDIVYSTWGTSKSIVLVARRDMKRLNAWIEDASTGVEQDPTEGYHPMDIEANMIWMWKMEELANAIDDAQPKRGYDNTMGRRILEEEIIEEEGLCRKLMYLPTSEMREALHAEFEAENWEVD